MANPPGTRANRWTQVVAAVAGELGWSTTQADAWLNTFWSGMWEGDESAGDPLAYDRLRKWLEANDTTSPTLPVALRTFVT